MTHEQPDGHSATALDAPVPCPLCKGTLVAPVLRDRSRSWLACSTCELIFLHPNDRLLPLQEVLRYLEHQNDAGDPAYVAFLTRLMEPVCDSVPVGARGLDFGCGPAAVLAELLTATGRPTTSFDPVFYPNDSALTHTYDFVTCSEVVEHSHQPASLFAQLGKLLRPNGTLAVMTRFHGLEAPFARWWYRRDPTHVSFYNARTMKWIAQRFGWGLTSPAPNVALFRRGEDTPAR